MTKQDLIEALVHDTMLPRSSAIKAVEGTIKALSGAIARGESITLRGFATIRSVAVAARTWRNPHTGTMEQLPASRRFKFIPSVELKNSINHGTLD